MALGLQSVQTRFSPAVGGRAKPWVFVDRQQIFSTASSTGINTVTVSVPRGASCMRVIMVGSGGGAGFWSTTSGSTTYVYGLYGGTACYAGAFSPCSPGQQVQLFLPANSSLQPATASLGGVLLAKADVGQNCNTANHTSGQNGQVSNCVGAFVGPAYGIYEQGGTGMAHVPNLTAFQLVGDGSLNQASAPGLGGYPTEAQNGGGQGGVSMAFLDFFNRDPGFR